MTSLPPQLPERRRIPSVISAYNKCLQLETFLKRASATNGVETDMDLIHLRIVGYLLHFVPTDRALKVVVWEIVSAVDDTALIAIGKMYYDHYLRAFRANRSHTPAPSDQSPRSFDTIVDMIKDVLSKAKASRDHCTAKAQALIRDGYRCVVTGRYDFSSVVEIQELHKMLTNDTTLTETITECVHIFPESTNPGINPRTAKLEYVATLWTIMTHFGYEKLPDELNGDKVHRLENVITVCTEFRGYFDSLRVWLVPTDVPNQYRIDSGNPIHLRKPTWKKYITFTTPDPVRLPLPSPEYLALHAACAQVAHFSGASACINKFYDDMDDMTTLDPQDYSAGTLEHAIFQLQLAGYPIVGTSD